MRFKRLILQGLIIGAGLYALLMLQGKVFESVLREQQHVMVRRLQKTVGALLQNAHRAKDDLNMLQTVRALADSPGLHSVSVVDPSGRIMADSRPARLGEMTEIPYGSPTTFVYPLGETASPWARLVFSLPNEPLARWTWERWSLAGLITVASWLLLLFYLQALENKKMHLQSQLADVMGLLELGKQKLQSVLDRERASEHLWTARLSAALEQLPKPAVFLDDHQRVVAVNRPMLEVVHSGDAADWVGRSWQDVPLLQACGSALEGSLQLPGQAIEVQDPFPRGRLVLTSQAEAGGEAIGTWVTLLDS